MNARRCRSGPSPFANGLGAVTALFVEAHAPVPRTIKNIQHSVDIIPIFAMLHHYHCCDFMYKTIAANRLNVYFNEISLMGLMGLMGLRNFKRSRRDCAPLELRDEAAPLGLCVAADRSDIQRYGYLAYRDSNTRPFHAFCPRTE